ncbi:hypothetical protein ACIO51_04455 [Providencia stuartii]|uniref:Uncharacterized protein n=1 Tax=Providencia stuartii ATCC 25827 TaxID=471874 RepID=A0AA87CTA3_PROST|nr:hypothetical protein PROSTU_02785 [Providencia stuartii ATCC 25827]
MNAAHEWIKQNEFLFFNLDAMIRSGSQWHSSGAIALAPANALYRTRIVLFTLCFFV